MELAVRRNQSWKVGALAIAACLVSLSLGARVQVLTGNAGVLLGMLLFTAVVSWYAGRWAGLATTGVGVLAACYFFLPPLHSLRILEPQDTGALYSFAIGGVIISLLCGAAWQLRAEARSLLAVEGELVRLRTLNSDLVQKSQHQDAAQAATDRLLREFARSTCAALEDRCAGSGGFANLARLVERSGERSPRLVDCNAWRRPGIATLPAVWADETDIAQLFEILATPELSASQLPDWWLFAAVFGSTASPLSAVEYCACERLVVRQGGRCWSNTTSNGRWEFRFLLPRHA